VSQYSNEALGQVVRGLRERNATTQEDLGRTAGYRTGAGVSISRLECGLLHPGAERFAGLAKALGLTPEELEARASAQTADNVAAASAAPGGIGSTEGGPPDGRATSRQSERPKHRALRIQREVDERTRIITELTEAFNTSHDRARDEFFMRLHEVAPRVEGAPRLDPTQLQDDDATGPDAAAAHRPESNSDGVAQPPREGRRGAAASAAVGSAAVLAGIVATPSLIFAAGGLIYMAKRNRKQQQELAAKLDEAETELAATRPGVQALQDLLPRATETLDYIATHAGHALTRWENQLDPGPSSWDSLGRAEQRRYQDFVDIADAQVRIVTINVQGILTTRGRDQDQLIQLADELLTRSNEVVNAHV